MASNNIGAGQTYTTVQGWEDAANVSSSTWEGVIVDASEFNENVTISGPTGTPDATNYIKLSADSDSRHDGTYNTSKARIRGNSSGTHVITISEDYTYLNYLAIAQQTAGDSDECVRITSGTTDVLVEKCVFALLAEISNQDCIYAGDWGMSASVFDCAFYVGPNARAGIHAQNYQGSGSQTWHIEHCTIDASGAAGGIHGRDDSSGSTTMNVDNCAVFDAGTADYQTTGGTTWSGQGNIGSDTSCTARLGTTNNTNSVSLVSSDQAGNIHLVTDLTVNSEDYQLVAASTGTNSAVDNAVSGATQDARIDTTVDIAGNARPGTYTNRDSGAFEIAASESAAITGTAEPSATESEIVTGGETTIITLTNDTWVAAGAGAIGSEADTQAIIDGVSAATTPANGWNNEVRDKEAIGSVARTSSTVATITWTAAAAYSVTADDTITVTVPAAVLVTSGVPLTATPTFTATNETSFVPYPLGRYSTAGGMQPMGGGLH